MIADPRTITRLPVSAEDVESFHENGYLVVEDLFSPDELEVLNRETVDICRGQRGLVTGLPPVTAEESDEDVIAKTICVHFPHKVSETFHDALAQPGIVEHLTAIIGENVKCMQSMLFIKSAGKPGQAWHQDEAFIPTRDRSLTAAWIAMDDATPENGCLWVIPGSHRRGIIWPTSEIDDERYDCAQGSVEFPYTDEDGEIVPVKAGSVVFFNGYLLHRSLPNYAETGFRRSLVHHYMSAESLLPWRPPAESYTMATADVRDIVMVAGEDPYAYKGTDQSIFFSHVRPQKEGGCQWPTDEDRRAAEAANGKGSAMG